MTDISHLSTQAARDTAPTVAPVEGCYALLRSGQVIANTKSNGAIWQCKAVSSSWYKSGRHIDAGLDYDARYDIIAVIPPDRLFAPDQSAKVAELIAAAQARLDGQDVIEPDSEAPYLDHLAWARNEAAIDMRLINAIEAMPCALPLADQSAGAERLQEAMTDIVAMIANCAGVLLEPDSLPQMVLYRASQALKGSTNDK
jgi:hypothetical protein